MTDPKEKALTELYEMLDKAATELFKAEEVAGRLGYQLSRCVTEAKRSTLGARHRVSVHLNRAQRPGGAK